MSSRDVVRNRGFVQFLGTGAGDCIELHAGECNEGHCVRAKELGGRNLRHAPSLFISPDVLVDFHSEAQTRTHGIAAVSVHHLLITHTHYDHFQPVAILDFAATLSHPLTVYGSANVESALDFAATYRWNASAGNFEVDRRPSNVQVRALRPGEEFAVGDMRVTPVLANHGIDKSNMIQQEQSLNYVFEFERSGKALFYGLDSSYTLPETLQTLSQFRLDIAVFDATFGYLDIDPFLSGHRNFAMLEKTIARFREQGIVGQDTEIATSHISHHSVEPHDEIADGLAEKGIVLAFDGMVLEL